MEDLAFDRATLEDVALCRLELVEAGREQRLQRGRHDHVALRLSSHRDHLRDEQRVAARRPGDSRPQPPAMCPGMS